VAAGSGTSRATPTLSLGTRATPTGSGTSTGTGTGVHRGFLPAAARRRQGLLNTGAEMAGRASTNLRQLT